MRRGAATARLSMSRDALTRERFIVEDKPVTRAALECQIMGSNGSHGAKWNQLGAQFSGDKSIVIKRISVWIDDLEHLDQYN